MSTNAFPFLNPTGNEGLNLLDSLELPKEEKEVDPNAEQWIIHSKTIDTKTVKRTRIRLTPAVCDKCGFDVLGYAFEQKKISTNVYEELPENVQLQLQEVVKIHKQLKHSQAEELIVSKKPKQWLSGRDLKR